MTIQVDRVIVMVDIIDSENSSVWCFGGRAPVMRQQNLK